MNKIIKFLTKRRNKNTMEGLMIFSLFFIGVYCLFFSAVINIQPAYNYYNFYVEGASGYTLNYYHLDYDFYKNEGVLYFKIESDDKLNPIEIGYPDELEVIEISLINDSLYKLKESFDYKLSEKQSDNINSHFTIYDINKEMNKIEVSVYFKGIIYPNGQFDIKSDGKNVYFGSKDMDMLIRRVYESMSLNLGHYRCSSVCISDSINSIPTVVNHESNQILLVSTEPKEKRSSVTINTYNSDIENFHSIFQSFSISLIAGSFLLFYQFIFKQGAKNKRKKKK